MTPATSFLPARPNTYLPEGLLIVIQTYGSNAFSYDLDAALAAANNGPREIGKPRTHDRLIAGFDRSKKLPSIVGLFNGNVCRRCEAAFTHPDFDRNEHREWHEWKDENTRCEEVTPELERLCYEGDKFAPPTLAELEEHRVRFEPKGVTFKNHRADHPAAVDDVVRIYGLSDSASDLDAEIVRLSETMPAALVAVRVGKSKSYVYSVLRKTRKPGSASATSKKEAA